MKKCFLELNNIRLVVNIFVSHFIFFNQLKLKIKFHYFSHILKTKVGKGQFFCIEISILW